MLDIDFLNKKASKFITFLKKTKKLLDHGLEEFTKTPIYVDRAEYYILSAYNELEEMACYLLKKVSNIKQKENCLEKLAKEQIFSDKINRAFLDLVQLRKNLFENSFKYPAEKLYPLLKDIIDNLEDKFLKELATLVKELKEKEPKLKIAVNLKKINEQAKAINGAKNKLKTFVNYSEDEFKNSAYAIDRTRYYLVVAIDGALWICKHISRKLGLKPSKNCFENLAKEGYLSKELAEFLQKLADLREKLAREKLANPQENIDTKFLYDLIKNKLHYFDKFLKEVAKIIFEGKEEKKTS